MSQIDEIAILNAQKDSGPSEPVFEVLNTIMYDLDEFLQNITYGLSLLVIASLISLIFVSFKIEFKRDLVFRSVVIILLLSVATLLNREFIIYLIPHQVII